MEKENRKFKLVLKSEFADIPNEWWDMVVCGSVSIEIEDLRDMYEIVYLEDEDNTSDK
ncbi:MAG TPA: hypothetical protein VD999_03615 [Vitreimonas sp.]|nr:hypothetical protein [Vitreimonas sp.]